MFVRHPSCSDDDVLDGVRRDDEMSDVCLRRPHEIRRIYWPYCCILIDLELFYFSPVSFIVQVQDFKASFEVEAASLPNTVVHISPNF